MEGILVIMMPICYILMIARGTDGNRLDNEVIASIQQFQAKERHGFIDVW